MDEYRVLLLCMTSYVNYFLKIISMMGKNFVSDVHPEFIVIYPDFYIWNTQNIILKRFLKNIEV